MGLLHRLIGRTPREPSDDIGRVDLYLKKWDEFAQDGPDPRYHLGEKYAGFEAALLRLFAASDPRAPGRFVFYQLVQVGGFIEADSPLGQAFALATKGTCPTAMAGGDTPQYFAGDLYFWWLDHAAEYEPMPLMDAWMKRDLPRNSFIPMYAAVREQKLPQN